MHTVNDQVTGLLLAWNAGDESALEKLIPLVYDELHHLAKRYVASERPGHTLQATALVNEAYVRLVDMAQVQWQNRAHFFALTARLMRRILVDFARSRSYQKRGSAMEPLVLEEALLLSPGPDPDLVALDDALNALAKVDPRKARVVEMRFFGGLSVEEVAEVLKVSQETILRDWRIAKSWLLREVRRGGLA